MTRFRRCTEEREMAAIALFMLEYRHELHRSFTTMDMVALLYSYMTEGCLLYAMDGERIVGAMGYYHGTRERSFLDRDIVLADAVLFIREYQRGRNFAKGLAFALDEIACDHPEAQVLQLAALAENRQLCRLYGKFAVAVSAREGFLGMETIFEGKISSIRGVLCEKYGV